MPLQIEAMFGMNTVEIMQFEHAQCSMSRGRQGLKISTGSLLSGPNVQQAAPAPHLADLQFTAGSLLPIVIY